MYSSEFTAKRFETFSLDRVTDPMSSSVVCEYVCMFLAMGCVLLPGNKPFTRSKTPQCNPIGLNALKSADHKNSVLAAK